MSMRKRPRWPSASRILALVAALSFIAHSRWSSALQVQGSVEATGSQSASMTQTSGLKAALDGVGVALGRIRVDRWKLPRAWKTQIRSDADSIEQDLTGQIPGLLSAAQQAPGAIAPQVRLMHNVDALYDVLVRISMAASLTGSKDDAARLTAAVSGLESARKSASAQLLAASAARDEQVQRLERAAQAQSGPASLQSSKTIVVDDTGHHVRRRKPVSHKKSTTPTAQSAAHAK